MSKNTVIRDRKIPVHILDDISSKFLINLVSKIDLLLMESFFE